MSKSAEQIAKELAAFFPVASLGWLPGPTNYEKTAAMALPYIDARDVMDRLDEVVGTDGWQDTYEIIGDGLVKCRLAVLIGGIWITKEDAGGSNVGDNTDRDKSVDKAKMLKAALSDALKRCAVHFGVGRYLYRFPDQWVDFDSNKKRFAKQPMVPLQFMLESDKTSRAGSKPSGDAPKADPAKNEPKPPQGAVAAKDIPKTGKALKERLEKANKEYKGILEFVAHCGILWGYPSDITKWSGDQLKESVSFGKEFVRRAAEKTPKIKEEQDAEIRTLIAGDLEKMQKACKAAQAYAADNLTEAEAAKVIEVLKKVV